jgi:hypothetical protein
MARPPALYADCCPACRYVVDAAMNMRDGTALPDPGDLSICLNCGALLQFDALLRLRLPDDLAGLLDGLSRRQRRDIRASQMFILKRGFLPGKDP